MQEKVIYEYTENIRLQPLLQGLISYPYTSSDTTPYTRHIQPYSQISLASDMYKKVLCVHFDEFFLLSEYNVKWTESVEKFYTILTASDSSFSSNHTQVYIPKLDYFCC